MRSVSRESLKVAFLVVVWMVVADWAVGTAFRPGATRLPELQRFAVQVAFLRLLNEFVSFARKSTPPGVSRTLDEVAALQPMVLGVVASAANGGGLLHVDS